MTRASDGATAIGRTRVLCAILTLVFAWGTTQPAHALDPGVIDKAVGWVNKGISFFKQGRSAFDRIRGVEAPSTAALLRDFQQNIIDEIRYWQLLQLESDVRVAVDKFQDLLANPDQTENNRERLLYLTGASSSNDIADTLFELERLLGDTSRPELVYQLTTPYNVLSLISGISMALHDSVFPTEAPFSWWSWNDLFGRLLEADYRMVGSTAVHCWEGFNPGRGNYHLSATDSYRRSFLWEKRIANYSVSVGQLDRKFVGAASRGEAQSRSINGIFYHGGEHRMWYGQTATGPALAIPDEWINAWNIGSTRLTTRADAEPVAETHATGAYLSAWVSDPVVTNISAHVMQPLFELNGGDEHNGVPGNLELAQFFDARVPDGLSCPQSGWAYPTSQQFAF
jgi:hypothetical protein